MEKLYVVMHKGEVSYIGRAEQSVVGRIRQGMIASYPFRWRRHNKVDLYVCHFDRKGDIDFGEGVEAELVYLLRQGTKERPGIATGALIVSRWKIGWPEQHKLAGVILLAILFSLLLPSLTGWLALTRAPLVSYGAMAVSGIFGGAVFALTNTFSLLRNSTTGAVYAADMFGAEL